MPFEQHKRPLLPKRDFLRRQARYTGFSLAILAVSLGLGTDGYHVFGSLSWTDAFLNASMILTGMGPVDRMDTETGKLFASFYALYSGIAFLTLAGVLFAPGYHRFLHKMHLDMDNS
jgi:hypothetical protein